MSQPGIAQMSAEKSGSTSGLTMARVSDPSYVMALAGLVFCVIAAILYGLLFYQIHQLPSDPQQLGVIRTNTPTLLKLLMIACSGGLLNLVALALCLYGLIQSQGSSRLAIIGITLSGLLLLAIPAVVLIGSLA